MKDTHFLYSIATLAIGSILVIFVSYATDSLPIATSRHSTAAIATPAAKKNCGCCAKMSPQELKTLQQRNEELRKQRTAYKKATELLKQHGLEEGLRRIKQSDPEIAAQLEHFTKKYTVAQEH